MHEIDDNEHTDRRTVDIRRNREPLAGLIIILTINYGGFTQRDRGIFTFMYYSAQTKSKIAVNFLNLTSPDFGLMLFMSVFV